MQKVSRSKSPLHNVLTSLLTFRRFGAVLSEHISQISQVFIISCSPVSQLQHEHVSQRKVDLSTSIQTNSQRVLPFHAPSSFCAPTAHITHHSPQRSVFLTFSIAVSTGKVRKRWTNLRTNWESHCDKPTELPTSCPAVLSRLSSDEPS